MRSMPLRGAPRCSGCCQNIQRTLSQTPAASPVAAEAAPAVSCAMPPSRLHPLHVGVHGSSTCTERRRAGVQPRPRPAGRLPRAPGIDLPSQPPK